MNTTKPVDDSTVHALHKCTGALGSPTKHPGQKKLKAGITEEGASDRTGNSITVNIVWQKKKKKKIVKKKNHKGTQAALRFLGCRLRTGRRCWGHTAGGALWMGRSWPLG